MQERFGQDRPGTDVSSTSTHQVVLAALAQKLRDRSSAMAVDGGLDPEFERNVVEILDEAIQLVRDTEFPFTAAVTIDYSISSDFDRTGRMRAKQDIHPAESLMAAEVLFDTALPVLANDRNAVPDSSRGAIVAARALHHAIWRRFPPGAIAYAEALRQRLSAAHLESRQRLSRDLHDRVAHTIAAGIQRIELATIDDSPASLLDEAIAILRSGLVDVRDLAVELRSRVGGLTIDQAISRYVGNTSTPRPAIIVHGDPRWERPWVVEELFAILVEAIRNAREHACGATSVVFEWSDEALTITVRDSGPGFNPDSVRPASIGLADMAERATMIGAHFVIETAAGQGTAIVLTLPTNDSRLAGS